ncbi:MAG TPA: NAD-dependent epimerase/dehydratase family protein [Thermoleophilia bacterium]|nr:NAD-dependent epimerase/dehydratase family protein [Thermoleophilia bacterium]
MLLPRNLRFSKEIAVRLVADAVMVSVALLIGLMLRFLWLVDVEGGVSLNRLLLGSFLREYVFGVTYLLPISLSVFALSGLYTHRRVYRARYKALVIAQAVSLSYLTFGFLAFLFPSVTTLPPGALFAAWILTVAFLIAARVWAELWLAIIRVENRLDDHDSIDGKIKNVLVIGGAGYIGSALLPKLLSKGYHVRLLDLLLFGTEPIADVINHPELEIVRADFRQVDKVVGAMRKMDAVIHLGAIVGDPACALDEELTIEINIKATRMIAEVAKGNGVNRFIFASTCSVYGASDEILDEHSALNPVSLYARSKIASEKVLRKMASDRFAPVVLRFGTVYGLSGRTRFDLVVNLLAAKAVVDGQITVFGSDQWRPFVHVDDAALAVFNVLEAPQALVHNHVFNVGSDEQNYTLQQVGEIIHRMVPGAELISSGLDGDRRNYRVNFSKIGNMLGFAPQRTLEQGIQQVTEAIEAGKVKDYRDAKYSNVKYLGEARTSHLIDCESDWAYQLLNEITLGQQSMAKSIQTAQPLQSRAVGAD